MRRLFLMFALMLAAVVSCRVCHAQDDLTAVQRVRVILDLLKDGDVATPASYAGVDLMPAPAAVEWADVLIKIHRPQYAGQLAAMTADQKSTVVLNIIRSFFRTANETIAAQETEADRAAAIAAAAAEADAAVGADEPVEP